MFQSQTFKIKGMHCASCAATIEKTLKKSEGVASAEVNYGTETAKISFDEKKTDPQSLSRTIEPLGYSFAVDAMAGSMDHAAHIGAGSSKEEKLKELEKMKRNVFSAIPLAAFSALAMIWEIFIGAQPVFLYILPLMATYVLFVVGQPYLLGVYRFIRYGAANMETLIGIGTSVAYIYSIIITLFQEQLGQFINIEGVYFDVTIIVITFVALGEYLEARAKLKTGDAIEKLLGLQAKTALVIRNKKEQEISVDLVIIGDLVIVKPGGKIPVDGTITEGSSYVDEAMITGEPMPVGKNLGDTVIAGTINTNGVITFKATKIGSETMLARIIKMVEEAQGSKAPIQALVDKISGIFVPIVLILSFVALGSWLLIGTSYLGLTQAISFGLVSLVSILVIACPCALGLATPTAIIVGVGKGAREGILVKDAATLETLHKVDTVVVDKTGTITKGKPELISLENFSSRNKEALIGILASLEKKSEHPIAHAIVEYASAHKISLSDVGNFENIKGKGIKGAVGGTEYFAGNAKLVADLNILFDGKFFAHETIQGRTPVILATAKEVLAVALVADKIKDEALEAVKNLHQLGIKIVMLTGDDKNTAAYIAKEVGIDDVVAEVLPEDKLKKIRALQAEGRIVAMAGDGVNDAPALAQADVGIAMATGTDVAIESAGITLLHGDISKLVKAIRLSKITMRGIKQNLFWAFIYNTIGIPLAGGLFYPFFGWTLNPIFAGMAMAFSSVSVVSNSLRLKFKKL